MNPKTVIWIALKKLGYSETELKKDTGLDYTQANTRLLSKILEILREKKDKKA